MHKRPYEDLIVWQESYKLCLYIYHATKKFPQEERFALTNQLRRSAYSVPTNIAEGNMKQSRKEKAHFLEIALASLEELHCECRLAKDLGYIMHQEFATIDQQINRISYLGTKLRAAFR
ncbi:MAG: four helix bundle protein [Candidatus Peribacteraceae bacterium]|jgi:four helix bundle protein